MSTFSPVRGFLPIRFLRFLILKTPKPRISILPPSDRAFRISSRNASNTGLRSPEVERTVYSFPFSSLFETLLHRFIFVTVT